MTLAGVVAQIEAACLSPQAERAVKDVVHAFTVHLEHAAAHLLKQTRHEYGDAMEVYLRIVRDAAVEAGVQVAKIEGEIAARQEICKGKGG